MKINRRKLVAGAAALPLLPAATIATPAEHDPVVAAFGEWKTLDAECKRTNGVYAELENRFGAFSKKPEGYWADFVSPTYDQCKVVADRISQMTAASWTALPHRLLIANCLRTAWHAVKALARAVQLAAVITEPRTPEQRELDRLHNKTRWSPADYLRARELRHEMQRAA